MVEMTVFVVASITETRTPLFQLVTYTRVPEGLTATPCGPSPTCTVAMTVLLVVSITQTLWLR